MQQWLSGPDKAPAAVKQAKAEVAKLWLEVKATVVQTLFACQDAVVHGWLPSAADRRSACKVRCSSMTVMSLEYAPFASILELFETRL